jgi:peptidyl-tRNA hydrolase
MKPAMYTFINKGLGMSTGKSVAQGQHAAVESYRLTEEREKEHAFAISQGDRPSLIQEWYKGGHYMKLVMQARDEAHLHTIERYLNDRGFKTALIIDEGRTEIPALTATALGVEIVDKDDEHTKATFSAFELYKDPKPEPTTPIYGDDEEPFDHVRVPETPEFKERYPDKEVPSRVTGGDGKTVRNPRVTDFIGGGQFFERYLNDPDNIVRDVDAARKIFGDLKKPR